jgi:hypothetical protein
MCGPRMTALTLFRPQMSQIQMNMQSQHTIAPSGANAQWQYAHIYPYSGHFAKVFWSFSSAMSAGLLSRSLWKQKGMIVADSDLPTGIVIEGKGINKGGVFFEPVLKEEGDYATVAIKWYEVFSISQTTPKPERKKKNSSISSKPSYKELPIQGSSMTEKLSQQETTRRVVTNGNRSAIKVVNNVRAYVPEGLNLPDNCSVRHQIWWFLGLLFRRDMFVTTIHDSVLVRKSDCDQVVAVFQEEFSRQGISPKLQWKDVASYYQGKDSVCI